MLNRIQLIGRLTRDPELRYTGSGHPLGILSYTPATQRVVVQTMHDTRSAGATE